ncbi:MAG: hypothetical protein A3I89_01775 [Candidatus Harrisonbacteria bacterium RIFCSPLOWO2_02_FULL_41_11]|uniref:Uncharacterized protein n=1 Tax=Candidatus Harrisonbacteria bacterium RIFCSPHIGHO2_02_FULL_42_16 TaxID=1798404 RepID=A0A1G1ZFX5_9BACT|nr:MAG: hypothetical protein A3B92_02035 [Candidatus Harrisonbacteria bacterium RIFCSPHIGHO2_02_FULL_42_16]OGY65593.1 MAG: hypothetical protein A3I89_01775 [Candidatus Harrisonbacteria bacterium RIFCSPLOWO2_02_FULL_41_11]
MNGEHSKFHWYCCWRPTVKLVFWFAAVASLAMAWYAVYKKGLVFGLEPLAWYWNALVLGVLSMGKMGKSHGYCGACMPEKNSGM